MDSLFLNNTACISGEYQYNGRTIKITRRSNPCSIKVIQDGMLCDLEDPCISKCQDMKLCKRQRSSKEASANGKIDSIKEQGEKMHARIHIANFHCICSAEVTDSCLRVYHLKEKAYLKIQCHYVLRYYNRQGQRKCYCGEIKRRVFGLEESYQDHSLVKIADYHYQVDKNGDAIIRADVCCF